MGVLNDYFRAPGAEQAALVVDGGPLNHLDTVAGLEPDVVLGQLIGFVRDVEWHPGLSATTLVSDEDSEFEAWVCEFADDVRDTLADIPAADVPALARRWAGIEELATHTGEPLDLAPHLHELIALAARSRATGEHLYVWRSL
ncbi:hypothetical protein AB0A63_10000 [Lentzea sp. NPDC042327]|uniref:hypothetical protein n=1 Tax=Lentzea sp. NPDC042327 TaxID=3154801 RepID=UPI0033E54636